MNKLPPGHPCHYDLRFQPLAPDAEGLSFPCDAEGHVDLDGLSKDALCEYLFARAVMGRQLTRPSVQARPGR